MTTITVNRKDATFINLNMREWFTLPNNNTLFIKTGGAYARRLFDDAEVLIESAQRVARVKSVIVETE